MTTDFDLVILNGRVMDPETMYDAVANVGVKNGKIAVITKNIIKGKKTIDATSLVVAPGFIDTQFHALDEFGIKHGALNGLTTALDTESSGINVAKWYDKKAGNWPLNYGTTAAKRPAGRLTTVPQRMICLPV